MRTEHEAAPVKEGQVNILHWHLAQLAGLENTAHCWLVPKEAERVSIGLWKEQAQAEAQEDCSSVQVPMAG